MMRIRLAHGEGQAQADLAIACGLAEATKQEVNACFGSLLSFSSWPSLQDAVVFYSTSVTVGLSSGSKRYAVGDCKLHTFAELSKAQQLGSF